MRSRRRPGSAPRPAAAVVLLAAVLVLLAPDRASAHVEVAAPGAVAGDGPVSLRFVAESESVDAGVVSLHGPRHVGRARPPDREQVIGRRLDTGAPLTGRAEHDPPDFAAVTDTGLPVIETFAHIRRAHPAHPRERFLRRSYNDDDPPAPGQLSNSGLVFVAFQADVTAPFVPVQRRLDELDLLNRWTTPVGSAVFAVPRGWRPGEYLRQPLLEQ